MHLNALNNFITLYSLQLPERKKSPDAKWVIVGWFRKSFCINFLLLQPVHNGNMEWDDMAILDEQAINQYGIKMT